MTKKAHREWIGGRVLTLLNHYYRDDDPSMMTKALAKDWKDVLQDLSQDLIQAACIQYMREEDRKKPTPGCIYRIASRLKWSDEQKPELRPMTPEEDAAYKASVARDRINPERKAEADAIMARFRGER